MNKKIIKIGLDFHGIIDKYPQYFAKFSQIAKEQGIKIYVITGGPYEVVQSYLKEHHIYYDEIFAILDFYEAKGAVEHFPNGEYKVPEDLWNKAKGEYCQKHGINIHIDDSQEYKEWFTTPFCIFDKENKQCSITNNLGVDFSQTPEEAIKQIQKISQIQVIQA